MRFAASCRLHGTRILHPRRTPLSRPVISTKIDKSHAKLMRKCWEGNVQKRSTMAEAARSLEFILGSAADASPTQEAQQDGAARRG